MELPVLTFDVPPIEVIERRLTITCGTCSATHTEDVPVGAVHTQSEWWNAHIESGCRGRYELNPVETWGYRG